MSSAFDQPEDHGEPDPVAVGKGEHLCPDCYCYHAGEECP